MEYIPKASLLSFRGKSLSIGDTFRLMYVGSESALRSRPTKTGSILPYLLACAYEHPPIVEELGTIGAEELDSLLIRRRTLHDLAVTEMPTRTDLSTSGPWLTTSRWLRWTLDISPSIEDISAAFSRDLRSCDLRRVARRGFTSKIARDADHLAMFYEDMYAPTVRAIPSDIAIIEPFDTILSAFRAGFLLFVMDGDQYVAGGVICPAQDTLRCTWLGIMGGRPQLRRSGVIAALCWFSILFGKENGFKTLDMGVSRPFLNDGLYRFKRKWGTTVKKDGGPDQEIGFAFASLTSSVEAFLSDNPIVFDHRGSLWGLVSPREDGAGDKARLAGLRRQHSSPGLRGLIALTRDRATVIDFGSAAVSDSGMTTSRDVLVGLEQVLK
jgi:hypothetical protein